MAVPDDQASGFPPVCTGSDLVLILGSFPGRSSLEKREYYGHRTNGFWPIMGQLLGFDPRISYPERLERLKINRVALWDVLTSCSRSGSLDSSIERDSMVVNDFKDFFETLLTEIMDTFNVPYVWITLIEDSEATKVILKSSDGSPLIKERVNIISEEQFNDLLDDYNASSGKSYTLSISLGAVKFPHHEKQEIEDLLIEVESRLQSKEQNY